MNGSEVNVLFGENMVAKELIKKDCINLIVIIPLQLRNIHALQS